MSKKLIDWAEFEGILDAWMRREELRRQRRRMAWGLMLLSLAIVWGGLAVWLVRR